MDLWASVDSPTLIFGAVVSEEQKPALLIDAKNCLYRAIHSMKKDRGHRIKYHYFIGMLRQINRWIDHHKPSSVHVFWDAPRTTVWRRKLLPTYKKRDDNFSLRDISKDLSTTTAVAKAFFPNMNVREYYRKSQEADDLIYAFVSWVHPRPTVIVSTDSDMTQMPYRFSSCQVYNPKKHEIVPVPEVNPVMQKALAGDSSDKIDGYVGIGPKKSIPLIESHSALSNFLDSQDANIFYRNLLLIDLSLNRRLLPNQVHVSNVLSTPVAWEPKILRELATKHKVQGFLQEFNDFAPRFKKLSEDL